MASNDLQNRFAERIKKRQDDMAKSKAAGDGSSPSPTPTATSDNEARFAERITQRRSKLGMDVEVDDSFISSFLTDANDYLENAHSSYNGLGYSNAASTYASMAESVVGLRSRSGAIARYLRNNRDALEPEYYDELSSILESFGQSVNEYQKAFYDADKFYSQFESEDVYNDWKNKEDFISAYLEDSEKAMETMDYDDSWLKEARGREDMKALDAEDFQDFSKYASTKTDNWWAKAWSQYSMGYDDLTYEYINNQDDMRSEILRKNTASRAFISSLPRASLSQESS